LVWGKLVARDDACRQQEEYGEKDKSKIKITIKSRKRRTGVYVGFHILKQELMFAAGCNPAGFAV